MHSQQQGTLAIKITLNCRILYMFYTKLSLDVLSLAVLLWLYPVGTSHLKMIYLLLDALVVNFMCIIAENGHNIWCLVALECSRLAHFLKISMKQSVIFWYSCAFPALTPACSTMFSFQKNLHLVKDRWLVGEIMPRKLVLFICDTLCFCHRRFLLIREFRCDRGQQTKELADSVNEIFFYLTNCLWN